MAPSMPVIMPDLPPLQMMMPEMSAQKYENCFPPYLLTMNDAFGIIFTGISLAEITVPMTQISSAQSKILCERCLYVILIL